MKSRRAVIILAGIMLLVFFVYIQFGSRDQATESHSQFISKEEQDTRILEEAKELSGLGSSGVWGTPTLISGDEVGIPFVDKSLEGKKIWCIDVAGAALEIDSKNRARVESIPLKLTILMDHDSGQIIKIRAVPEKGSTPRHSPKASIASAERQMQETGEIYTGFPEERALVNFCDALGNIYMSGFGGNPVEASEIEAVYVMQSHLRKEPRAVWAITLHGIPPIPTFGGNGDSVPISQRDHLRNIVDAKTGEVLRSTTVPQP